jgi:hypothetical protein
VSNAAVEALGFQRIRKNTIPNIWNEDLKLAAQHKKHKLLNTKR